MHSRTPAAAFSFLFIRAAGVRALTRSLAVEDFRGEGDASRLLCDEGVVQLAEAAGGGQEQVPQSSSPGLGLDARGQEVKTNTGANAIHDERMK